MLVSFFSMPGWSGSGVLIPKFNALRYSQLVGRIRVIDTMLVLVQP